MDPDLDPAPDRALAGEWRAAEADDHLRRSYADAGFDDGGWEPVPVPGHWRSVPAFAGSDGPLLYRGRFAAPPPGEGRRSWLCFDGLFYQGDVWLDGGYLGDTEGYFVPHAFEVTDALRDRSEHAVAVEVTCSPARGGARRNLTGVFQGGDHVDPAWNPGGIWRPVRLVETGPVRIVALRLLCREAGPERAMLALRAVLDADAAAAVRLRTELGAHDHVVDQPLAAGTNEVNWTVTVERPARWWPRALGEPTLHATRVQVLLDSSDGGSVSDERRLRTGLRTVRARRGVWSVNGERLFVKGTALGPTRPDLAAATAGEVAADVAAAAELGLDLVRVHGHVARPELYDAADEAGLLVWQDMPLFGPYARGIRRQAARQAETLVDLVGHHPSVALWCGHDQPGPPPAGAEGDALGAALAGEAARRVPTWNRSVLDTSVRRALERADGSRPVVAATDERLWLGWHHGDERALPALARTVPRLVRFVPAFGAPAVPSGDAAFAEPERWPDLDWDRLAAHHFFQPAAMAARVPPAAYEDFGAWRDATQRFQAQLLRREIEELRRLKYRPTGGFVQFRLADAHPGITPSVLDHERRPKAGHAALAAACAPVIVVADRLPATVAAGQPLALDVHVVSDRREAIAGAEVTAALSWPGGRHGWRWQGDVGADACARVGTIQVVGPAADGPGPLALDLALALPRGEIVTNRYEATLTV